MSWKCYSSGNGLTSGGASLLFALMMVSTGAVGQNQIPLGTWRTHVSFNNIVKVAVAPDVVFAACEEAVFQMDRSDGTMTSLTHLDGLRGSVISAMAYSGASQKLIIGFGDGEVNLLEGNEIVDIDRIKTANTNTTSKRINDILSLNAKAYLSTDFGIVEFDVVKDEIIETYRDLGSDGTQLQINKCVILNDSIFAATAIGVIGTSLSNSVNRLDYNNWKRYDQGALSGPVSVITVLNNQLLVGVNGLGLYLRTGSTWIQQPYLSGTSYRSLTSTTADEIIVTTDAGIASVQYGVVSTLSDNLITTANQALKDDKGKYWIADSQNGLVSDYAGSFERFKPNGPSSNQTWGLDFQANRIVSYYGGYDASSQPLGHPAVIDFFDNGLWTSQNSGLESDLTGYLVTGSNTYVASFGHGVEVIDATGKSTIFDETNSPLINSNPPGRNVLVSSLAKGADGIWVTNFNTSSPLHLLKPDLTWSSFSVPLIPSRFPRTSLADQYGYVWMTVDPLDGGGVIVFDKNNSKSAFISDNSGRGSLPSTDVRCLMLDRDGQVWLGTSKGVAYIPNPRNVFNTTFESVRPIFENQFLLRNQVVTSMVADGGNRKWIGTTTGVWLFDPLGESLIYNFTTDNSPLPSNHIIDIAIDDNSGEVFFATDKGMVSFRGNSTRGSEHFDQVKIFPNPVTREFSGLVAISGLVQDCVVKITDIAGHLIWQSRTNGGTASWDVRQGNGARVGTGMYLVFATTEDGSEHHVGKIAVIN